MKIYVGCSLTQAPEVFRQEVEDFKTKLRNFGHEAFNFIGLVAGTARDVYEWDIKHCVEECDLFVAICDYPSIGLGYELAVAVEKLGKRALAVAHRDAKITRLVLGINHPRFEFRQYDELDEVINLIQAPCMDTDQGCLCDVTGTCVASETTLPVSFCVYCGKELVMRDGQWWTWDADLHSNQRPQHVQ